MRGRAEEARGARGGDPLLHVAELALVAAQLPADDAEEDAGEEHEEAEDDEHGAHHLRCRAHGLKLDNGFPFSQRFLDNLPTLHTPYYLAL